MKRSMVEAYFSGVARTYQQASSGRLWGYVRRREARAVSDLLGDIRGKDILELGCGAGFYTRLLRSAGANHVWAVDLSADMLAQLPNDGITPIHGDATTVDVGRRFGTLLSAGMLEFVPDAQAALRHAATCATPGARLTILFPTPTLAGRAYRRFHARNGLSIRLFAPEEMGTLAAAAGWRLHQFVRSGPFSAAANLIREGGA